MVILLLAALVKKFTSKSWTMYGLSRLNNVATSWTLTHSSGTAWLGGCTGNCGRSFPSWYPTQIEALCATLAPGDKWSEAIQHRFHKLIGHCFQFAFSFFLLTFRGFIFSFSFCCFAVCVCPGISCHNVSSYFLVLPCPAWPSSTELLYIWSVLH